jgi:hypothetical protein
MVWQVSQPDGRRQSVDIVATHSAKGPIVSKKVDEVTIELWSVRVPPLEAGPAPPASAVDPPTVIALPTQWAARSDPLLDLGTTRRPGVCASRVVAAGER